MAFLFYLPPSKIQKYSPSESAKVYDKAINRKSGVHFHPKQTLEFLKRDMSSKKINDDIKRTIAKQYLDVSVLYVISVTWLFLQTNRAIFTRCFSGTDNSGARWTPLS